MPNRILRDWTDSDRVNSLSFPAESLFTRLIMKADDFGRFHAHTSLVKAACFPLRLDSVRDADIARWIAECEKAGLIVVFESKGRKYLQIENFKQRTRATESRFPGPAGECPTDDGQMSGACQSNDGQGAVNCQRDDGQGAVIARTETETETETFSYSETEAKTEAYSETNKGIARQSSLSDCPIPPTLFTDDFVAAWDEWRQYRAEIKKKVTPSIAKKQLSFLEVLGPARAILSINASIMNGWQGLFEPKEFGQNKRDQIQRESLAALDAFVEKRQIEEAQRIYDDK